MVPTRSEADKLNKKQQILDNAVQVLLSKGYEDTRISEIVKLSGIAQGTFYLYFSSKEDLFVAIAESFFGELTEKIFELLEVGNSLMDKMEATINGLADFIRERQQLMTLMHSPVASSILGRQELSDFFNSEIGRLLNVVSTMLEEGIEKGEIRPCQPQFTAFIIVSAIHEVLETATITFSEEMVGSVVDELKQFMRAALQA
jgi:AcrR family transcriptional regulator